MIAALAGMAGFALLFGIVGLMPLKTGSCHGTSEGSCGEADCATCPFADGGH